MSQKYRIINHQQLDSTQSELKRLLKEELVVQHLTTVAARTQINGKGRGVSVWQDAPGKSALFSVYISWPTALKESFLVNQWICHVLATIMPSEVQYKWPNDLMVGSKKLGGLLIENRWEGKTISSSIIGMGINVGYSENQLLRAVSLEELGLNINVNEVIEQILSAMDASVPWIANKELLDRRYHRLLWGTEDYQTYQKARGEEVNAIVTGVDAQGRLLLKNKKGQTHSFDLDDIRWVDPNV